LDRNEEKQFAWQNTFAISTREIGVMLAIHSDDKGAVVPPRLAAIQVVVVPIVNEESKKEVLAEAAKVQRRLSKEFRTRLDDRDQLTPGRKFNEWELKGVPLRVELGPRDLKAGQVVLVRRDTGAKRTAMLSDLEVETRKELDAMQKSLLDRAREFLVKNTHTAATLGELKEALKKGGVVRIHWCGSRKCEDRLKEETGGKIINIPLDQPGARGACVSCSEKSELVVNFAKSY